MLQRITDLWPGLLRRAQDMPDDLLEPLLDRDDDGAGNEVRSRINRDEILE